MNIIYQGRITRAIKTSAKRQIPILCSDNSNYINIIKKVKESNLNIPEPILFSFESYESIKNKQDVLIDDINMFIHKMSSKYNLISMTGTANNIYLKIGLNE